MNLQIETDRASSPDSSQILPPTPFQNTDTLPCRIDKVLACRITQYSRTYVQRLIANGHVSIDNSPIIKPSTLIPTNATIRLDMPKAHNRTDMISAVVDNLPVSILHMHTDFAIIHKPAGLTVHKASANATEITLVDWILAKLPHYFPEDDTDRPGIIHRLDKETSGLMIVAIRPEAQKHFMELFQARTVEKRYMAIVEGYAPESASVTYRISRHPSERIKMMWSTYHGKEAETHMIAQEHFGSSATLIEAIPRTGRTHQIRVHCSSIGHPLLGDGLYNTKRSPFIARHALHASTLAFTYQGQPYRFFSPLPEDMLHALEQLRRSERFSIDHSNL